ncbi:MAG: phage minor head protein [Oscillospiraceae bacterium]
MCDCDKLIKAIDAYLTKADDSLKDVLEAEGYVNASDTVKRTTSLEDAVAEALKSETDYFINAANDAIDIEEFANKIWPGIKLTDDLAEKLSLIFQEQLAEFLPELIEAYIQQTDKELILPQVSKRTTAWVKSWSKELGELMTLTSHNEIDNILTQGLKNGSGMQTFIQDILDSGIRDEYYKARRVAITETLRAHSVAQEESIQQSPAVEQKEWVHTGNYRNAPRQNHVDMNGQVVNKNKPFTLIGADGSTYEPQYPRDTILPAAESVNCHCIHRGIVSEKILGLSLDERKRLQAEAVAQMDDEWEKELDKKNKAKAGIDE